jgi:hypothetical protein
MTRLEQYRGIRLPFLLPPPSSSSSVIQPIGSMAIQYPSAPNNSLSPTLRSLWSTSCRGPGYRSHLICYRIQMICCGKCRTSLAISRVLAVRLRPRPAPHSWLRPVHCVVNCPGCWAPLLGCVPSPSTDAFLDPAPFYVTASPDKAPSTLRPELEQICIPRTALGLFGCFRYVRGNPNAPSENPNT